MAGDSPAVKHASAKPGKGGKKNTLKVKGTVPVLKQAGNWMDGSINDDPKKKKGSQPTSVAESPSPPVTNLEDNAIQTFHTGRPLEDNPDLQQCKHCKKSVLRTSAKAHIAGCLKLKKEKAQRKKEAREARERAKEAARAAEDGKGGADDDDDSDDDKKAGKKNGDEKGKKRKADGTLEGPKAKKKKDEGKGKVTKTKGPVDVERQCGVILANGQPCARSLTCKSHSMGAKRAVPGRSLPYDMLLAAYQKKNQAKQQKAALDATAPLEDPEEEDNGPVDSDEETAAVMSALSSWRPQPVVPQPVFQPIRRQYNLARLHEQLHMATNGGRTNIFAVNGFGAQRIPEFVPQPQQVMMPMNMELEDAPGEMDWSMTGLNMGNMGNVTPGGGATGQQGSRQASVTSRA